MLRRLRAGGAIGIFAAPGSASLDPEAIESDPASPGSDLLMPPMRRVGPRSARRHAVAAPLPGSLGRPRRRRRRPAPGPNGPGA